MRFAPYRSITQRRTGTLLAAALILLASGATRGTEAPRLLATDASLRALPESGILHGMLAAGAPVSVLEERQGWVRVRAEGWVPAAALGGEPPPTPPAPPAVPPTPPSPPPTAAPVAVAAASTMAGRVDGSVVVRLSRRGSTTPGEKAIVHLVPADRLAPWMADPDRAARITSLQVDLARTQRDADKALQSSNFTEGIMERDRLTAKRDALTADLLRELAVVHNGHEIEARAQAVASAVTDSRGAFVLPMLGPGRYVVYARLSMEGAELEWRRDVEVAAGVVSLLLENNAAANAAGHPL